MKLIFLFQERCLNRLRLFDINSAKVQIRALELLWLVTWIAHPYASFGLDTNNWCMLDSFEKRPISHDVWNDVFKWMSFGRNCKQMESTTNYYFPKLYEWMPCYGVFRDGMQPHTCEPKWTKDSAHLIPNVHLIPTRRFCPVLQ